MSVDAAAVLSVGRKTKINECHTRLLASAYQGCKLEHGCMMALPRVVKGTPNQPGVIQLSIRKQFNS